MRKLINKSLWLGLVLIPVGAWASFGVSYAHLGPMIWN